MQSGNEVGLDELGNWLKQFLEPIERWIEANAEAIDGLVRKARRHLLFKEAGWLPHHTTPFAMLDDGWSASELSAYLNAYYLDNWLKIREEFEKRLIAWKVDDEAKATFIEALEAHGLGLYRVAPTLLFPEIERLVRAGRVGNFAVLQDIRGDVKRQEIGLSELTPSGVSPFSPNSNEWRTISTKASAHHRRWQS